MVKELNTIESKEDNSINMSPLGKLTKSAIKMYSDRKSGNIGIKKAKRQARQAELELEAQAAKKIKAME